MKPFKINRDSWHYKLNRVFLNEYEHSMERNWEPRHRDFCSYWRATIFRVIVASILIFSFGVLFTGIGVATYSNPLMAVGVVLNMVAGIASVVLVIWTSEKIKDRNKNDEYKSQSLFMQKYRAHKSKICPMVEYD